MSKIDKHKIIDIYSTILHWRETHIKEKQFIIILSFVTGIGCALAALILKKRHTSYSKFCYINDRR